MLLPVLLEGEPQSGVIWYEIFRQSPNEFGLPLPDRYKNQIRRPRQNNGNYADIGFLRF